MKTNAISAFKDFNLNTQIKPEGKETPTPKTEPKREEFIDKILDKVKNKRDVEDCVAVPRGIFKAYMLIMAGSALLTLGGYLPDKLKNTKKGFMVFGTVLNTLSAFFFAKPFALKGLSATINKDEFKKQ